VLMSTMRNTTTGRSKGFCSGGQRCTVCRGIRHAERRLLLLIDLGFFPLYHAFILEDLQQFLVSYRSSFADVALLSVGSSIHNVGVLWMLELLNIRRVVLTEALHWIPRQ
jgi:hypothetical protein